MDQLHSRHIKENLEQEVIAVFKKTFGASLETETKRYNAVGEQVLMLVGRYLEKTANPAAMGSTSQLLFESENTCEEIRNYLEENLDERPNPKFKENLGLFREGIIALFGLPDPKEKAQKQPTIKYPGNESGANGFKKISSQLAGFFKGLLKKKDYGNLQSNRILSELVIKPLEQSEAQANRYFQAISELMLASWELSKLITQTIDNLVKANYDLVSMEKPSGTHELIDRVKQAQVQLLEREQQLGSKLETFINESVHNFNKTGIDSSKNHVDLRKLYSNQAIHHSLNRIQRKYLIHIHNWHNTMFVLADDWKLELEIIELRYYILKNNFDFANYIQSRFRDPLDEKIKIARETIASSIKLFEKNSENLPDNFMAELEKLRTDVKRKLLLKMVPEVRKIILDSNIPAEVDLFEKDSAQKFDQLSETRYIKKEARYDVPTEKSEMAKIAPHSLVAFQMRPDFMDAFPMLKQGYTRHLQEVQNRIEEIPEIINYSLHTCIHYFEEKQDLKEAAKIGLDGMKRAENKLLDVIQLLDGFSKEKSDNLNAEIENLTQNLAEITDNESALQINLRITRARAVEKSKEIRNKLWNYVQGFVPRLKNLFNKLLAFIKKSSIQIRKQFTLEDRRSFVSTDISDYLTETENAINRLPFIYQRLFKIEPLNSFELYTPRNESIDKMKTAYSRWKDGKFAPAVVISEKGWGKTTLLNRFLKLKLTTEEVIKFNAENYADMDGFYTDILAKTTLESNAAADKSTSRKIVIIDGLEKLFEARINGFDYLLKILQHISDTNKQIFWLTTCHLYAWDYLDKTISISDYFGYHIKLAGFSDQELVNTIERRHNISGYRLMFLPETQKKSLLSFKKQTEFGDQEELKQQYFARMNKIVKGNLSQAFLFWMRSTAQVTDDSVFIEYLSSDYFNFLDSMSDGKLMILKNIIIHNGISYEKHARLFRIPEEKSKLMMVQLSDDGVIIKHNNIYNINPIIYRQVVEHLYVFNILH